MRQALTLRQIAVNRWLLLACYVVISTVVVLLASYAKSDWIRKLYEVPTWVGALALSGLSVATIGWFRERWAALLGLRYALRYPPLVMAALVAASATLLLASSVQQIRNSLSIYEAMVDGLRYWALLYGLAACAPLLMSAAYAHRRPKSEARRVERVRKRRRYRPNVEPTTVSSFESLCRWLETDFPVGQEADAFGHSRIALRIAHRLTLTPPPAQAVIGRYGSGKSSLLAMVREALEEHSNGGRIRLVPVELWPYDTARSAVEGVIETLLAVLSKEVDTSSLRSMPQAYAQAISSADGLLGVIGRLHGISEPAEALERLDQVARITNLRFVVWIEDLERFAGGDSPDEEKLNTVRALLFGLSQLRAITVVTATTSLHQRFDLEKIARFVEQIPELDEINAGRILREFRSGNLNKDFLDIATAGVRDQLQFLGSEASVSVRGIFGLLSYRLSDALPQLCLTPRTLKHALRRCSAAWANLSGEIDFDDLLVLCVLRESNPKVFELIADNLAVWRQHEHSDEVKKSRLARWEKALDEAVPGERARRIVDVVIDFLFEDFGQDAKPQGVRFQRPSDYWTRFMIGDVPHGVPRDQPVLAAFKSRSNDSLVAAVTNSDTSATVEGFGHLLGFDRALSLLVPVVQAGCSVDVEAWGSDCPVGFLSVWRLLLGAARKGELPPGAVLAQVLRAYDVCVPSCLQLASQLEYYFTSPDGEVPRLMTPSDREVSMRYLRALISRTYANNADALVRGLRGANLWALARFAWGETEVSKKPESGPLEGWSEIAPTILEALRLNPARLLTLIASLVVIPTYSFGKTEYAFAPALAAESFKEVDAFLAAFDEAYGREPSQEPIVLAVINRQETGNNDLIAAPTSR